MIKTVLPTALALSLAAVTLVSNAEARGFGGGFRGHGIAVGEPNPGMHHGGFHHHGGWGGGFGWYGVGYAPFYGCYTRRFINEDGYVVVRQVCD